MGATTWTMKTTDHGRRLDVVFFPSASINPGVRLIGNARYPGIAADFERTVSGPIVYENNTDAIK